MKRIIMLALILALLGTFSGCDSVEEFQDPVHFYYLRNEFAYGSTDGAVTAEAREAAGSRNDPKYLLTLYLQGPKDQTLRSPFPPSVVLTDVQIDGKEMTVTLNADVVLLDELELSIAYTCLAQTCVSIADVDTIIIESRVTDGRLYFSRTITADQLLTEISQ